MNAEVWEKAHLLVLDINHTSVLYMHVMELRKLRLLHFIRHPPHTFQRMSSCGKTTPRQSSHTKRAQEVFKCDHLHMKVTHTGFIWPDWGGSWCLPRCCWWGNSCCSVWTAFRQAQWGTSQSSRPRRSCSPGSRWWTWGRSSGTCGRRWGVGAHPSGTRTRGGLPCHSRPPSQGAETLAQSHFQDGRTSERPGFLHSCSSPEGLIINIISQHVFVFRFDLIWIRKERRTSSFYSKSSTLLKPSQNTLLPHSLY